MFKNGAYYNGIGPYLKDLFGMRISKVSIDGGFSCPNRDGTAGTGGCIFCSETGSGDFAGTRILKSRADSSDLIKTPVSDESSSFGSNCPASNGILPSQEGRFSHSSVKQPIRSTVSVTEQMNTQIAVLRKKWSDFRCIAYFQNFTNTYAPVSVLREKFEEALRHPDCVGLAVATRPDCLQPEILDYLTELNKRTFLWVELGLQTSDDTSAHYIRRGYPLSVYQEAVQQLIRRDIRIVTHLIAGLPGEDRETFLQSVRCAVSREIFGIKLQLLHIMKYTDLGRQWQQQTAAASEKKPETASELSICSRSDDPSHEPPLIRPLEKDEYISWIADALEMIPPEITIHRLTGDAPKEKLLSPLWSRDKKSVLNGINMELKKRGSCQGVKI